MLRPLFSAVPAHPILAHSLRTARARPAARRWSRCISVTRLPLRQETTPFSSTQLPSATTKTDTTSYESNSTSSRDVAGDSSQATADSSTFDPFTSPSDNLDDVPPSSTSTSNSDAFYEDGAGSPASQKSPFDDLFSGPDPFPRVDSQSRWLSDSLSGPASSQRNRDRDRGKNTIPRSVLFTPETGSDDFPSRSRERRKYNRSPLSRSEANAFISLLNQALETSSSPRSDMPTDDNLFGKRSDSKSQPFGAYTSLISHASPQERNKYQLEAYASRNQLRPRFEESRMARARRSAREGLAAQVSQAQLDAGIDEAREELSMCENEFEVWEWAKKEVWGIGSGIDAPSQLYERVKNRGLEPVADEAAQQADDDVNATQVASETEAQQDAADAAEAQREAAEVTDEARAEETSMKAETEEAQVDAKTEEDRATDEAEAPSAAATEEAKNEAASAEATPSDTATSPASPTTTEGDSAADPSSAPLTAPGPDASAQRAPSRPRFGKETPYFAPVLHLVFLTLRERYRSPQSALAVYEVTRSLGIEPYILGCTAPLFADLLRTRWEQLGDLHSCRRLLRHARETGVLADPASRRREIARIKRQKKGGLAPLMPPAEDEGIREVVDRIRSEVRKSIVDDIQSRMLVEDDAEEGRKDLDQPSWAQQQALDLADELGNLAGPPSRILMDM
ncbi:hypothetical protein ACQY0O_006874 [Thecaphora frezii]